MNSKNKILTIGFVTIIGAMMFLITGCANNAPVATTPTAETELGALSDEAQENGSSDVYGSVEEIVAPAGLPSELKSIFSEACGEVKLSTLTYNLAGMNTDLLIYTWKNKPTEEKLMNLFRENGYAVEPLVVGIFTATKGSSFLSIDWNSPDREDGHEIVVSSEHE